MSETIIAGALVEVTGALVEGLEVRVASPMVGGAAVDMSQRSIRAAFVAAGAEVLGHDGVFDAETGDYVAQFTGAELAGLPTTTEFQIAVKAAGVVEAAATASALMAGAA